MKLDKKNPLSKGLVGCWLMNEAGGNKIFDMSGKGHHLALANGASWIPKGILFDGDDDNCNGNMITGMEMTIVQGVRAHTEGEGGQGRSIVFPAGSGWAALFHKSSSNAWNLIASFSDGTNENVSESVANVITQNKQHSIATVHDNATAPKIYVDGIEVNYQSQVFDAALSNESVTCIIGADNSTGSYAWDGEIYYTYIYDRGLSTQEIMWLDYDPYGMFEPEFTQSIITEAAAGTIPILLHLYNQMRQ